MFTYVVRVFGQEKLQFERSEKRTKNPKIVSADALGSRFFSVCCVFCVGWLTCCSGGVWARSELVFFGSCSS